MSAKALTIIGSLTSPYARIVRTLCEELEVRHDFSVTNPFAQLTPENSRLINSNNPLLRIPILIDDNGSLIESRIICQHLLRSFPPKSIHTFRYEEPLSRNEENRISVIYGALDSALQMFMLKRNDATLDLQRGYFLRMKERIQEAFHWLDENLTDSSEVFGFSEIVLVCCLEWVEKRQMFDWRSYTKVVAAHERFKDQPSLQKTRIPEAM